MAYENLKRPETCRIKSINRFEVDERESGRGNAKHIYIRKLALQVPAATKSKKKPGKSK